MTGLFGKTCKECLDRKKQKRLRLTVDRTRTAVQIPNLGDLLSKLEALKKHNLNSMNSPNQITSSFTVK